MYKEGNIVYLFSGHCLIIAYWRLSIRHWEIKKTMFSTVVLQITQKDCSFHWDYGLSNETLGNVPWATPEQKLQGTLCYIYCSFHSLSELTLSFQFFFFSERRYRVALHLANQREKDEREINLYYWKLLKLNGDILSIA